MDQPKAIKSILYGSMMGIVAFLVLRPDGAEIRLAPDEGGSYAQSITNKGYTADISESGHGVLMVDYVPIRPWTHYMLAIAFAVAIGMSDYRERRAKKAVVHHDPKLVTEHPQYPQFIEEDSDRTYFSGDELVATFSSWLSHRSDGSGAAQNRDTEQGADPNRDAR